MQAFLLLYIAFLALCSSIIIQNVLLNELRVTNVLQLYIATLTAALVLQTAYGTYDTPTPQGEWGVRIHAMNSLILLFALIEKR